MRCAVLLAGYAVLASLGGCVSEPPPEPLPISRPPEPEPAAPPRERSGLFGQVWRVTSLDGSPLPAEATLMLSRAGGVSGRGPCNGFGGEAAVSTNEIVFSGVISTKIACEPDVMQAERRYFAILSGVVQWRLEEDNSLILRGQKGVLRARP
jgi:heat shock protein HslJ